MVFPGLNSSWPRYPRWWASAHLPRLPCHLPSMLRENSKTCKVLRRVFRKAEDAGRLSPVKDDNAAKGGPVRPAGICAHVN